MRHRTEVLTRGIQNLIYRLVLNIVIDCLRSLAAIHIAAVMDRFQPEADICMAAASALLGFSRTLPSQGRDPF